MHQPDLSLTKTPQAKACGVLTGLLQTRTSLQLRFLTGCHRAIPD
ncbi:hypothetical protein SRA_08511 [Streptococcus ratti FA-1 = DSM 20564]|uniref:Uncharacterized protein n=1 Tax=Streptococcus ratti FA-1 = DSM 20564 TaxID=699248 RepID=A0ABN0GVM6_STRRT|nr:hypothetical protein SRA_08511 [Streptococcus ratti FA-1 = DSM 20564]